MTFKEILNKRISEYTEIISSDSKLLHTDTMKTFIDALLKNLESSELEQDFLLVVYTKESGVVDAFITGRDLGALDELLDANYNKTTDSEIKIIDTKFYTKFRDKFSIKKTLSVCEDSKVKDLVEFFESNEEVGVVPVVNDKEMLVGKIRRNRFVKRIIDEASSS